MFSSRRRQATSSSGYGALSSSITSKIGSTTSNHNYANTATARRRSRLDTRPTYSPDTKTNSYMSNFRSSRTLSSASRTNLKSSYKPLHKPSSSIATKTSLFRNSTSREHRNTNTTSRTSAMDSLTSRIGSMTMQRFSRATTPIDTTSIAASSASSAFSSSSASSSSSSSAARGKLCCDKCDGKHLTEHCPHYKKKRGKHPDEKKGQGKGLGDGSGGNFFTNKGRVVRQPGDGSCLFHSLAYGMRGTSASALRRSIAGFIGKNGAMMIADSPLSDWVKWESNSSCGSYARRMARGGWGGAIEMAACSRLKSINVHVYERSRGGFKRISCFNVSGASKTVHVLYGGRVHYDALVL